MGLWQLNVTDLTEGYRRREHSPLEVVAESLDRIETLDPELGAFRQVLAESAMRDAALMTEELAKGHSRGPLHGIPVAIKELFDVAGALGCYGSQVFAERISARDATAVERLRAAGAIVIGVTRSHEFGWGITTQHEHLGNAYNPWDTNRVPGGSSGGSAVALAAGMVPLALGTDTGGSVRIPAAFCGVVGLKPTFGTISRRGVVPLAASLDHVGPMVRTVEDLAIALAVLAGFDPEDPVTDHHPIPSLAEVCSGRLDGIRVGTAPSLHLTPLAPDYEGLFTRALAVVTEVGGETVEVPLPQAERIRPVFTAIQMAEAYHSHSAELGTFPSRADAYGPDVRGRLQAAAEVGIRDYLEAQGEAQLIRRRFDEAFEIADVILTPVSAGPPSTASNPDETTHLGHPIPFRELVMDYTVPQDITGLPACVVPVGFDSDNLPVGIQVTAPRHREDLALVVASALHKRLGSTSRWPV